MRTSSLIPQFGLGSLMTLIAVIAVWLGAFANRRELPLLTARWESLKGVDRRLEVTDSSKIAFQSRLITWGDEIQWDCHFPPGEYELCVAEKVTENDRDRQGRFVLVSPGASNYRLERSPPQFVQPSQRVAIPSDTRYLKLNYRRKEKTEILTVRSADQELLHRRHTAQFDHNQGSRWNNAVRDQDPALPFELFAKIGRQEPQGAQLVFQVWIQPKGYAQE